MREDWLAARGRRSPRALALVCDGRRWTYGELEAEVALWAAQLARLDVDAGRRVGVLLPNGAAFVRLVHALARLGAVLVPLNRRLTSDELSWQVHRAACTMLLYDETTAAQARAVDVEGLTLQDVAAFEKGAVVAATSGASRGMRTTAFDLDALQAIVFTSGTTGRPKGARLTFGNHFWSATASAFRLGLHKDDRWLSCLPLYHVGGLAVLFRSCLYGTAVILHDGFDVAAFNESLDREGVTMTSLVPTMLYRLLPTRETWPSSLRLVLVGGAATTADLAQRCAQAGVPLATTYGLTEAASQVATLAPERAVEKPGCVGSPLMFTEVRIIDGDGESVAVGEIGEIAVHGPTVMEGYDGDVEATGQALVDGELRTGDIGYLDGDGDLWVLQRRKDVIVSGGENVYPAEVERVLREHDAVAAACVVGVPHAEWGQQVAAMVALHRESDVGEEAFLAFCRARLAGYKLPRRVVFVDALPMTASGKVARGEVLEIMAEL